MYENVEGKVLEYMESPGQLEIYTSTFMFWS